MRSGPSGDTLVLETMYYADEVRQPEEVAGRPRLRKAEVDMAKTLIENLAAPWEPEKYHDRYRNELLELLREEGEGRAAAGAGGGRAARSST